MPIGIHNEVEINGAVSLVVDTTIHTNVDANGSDICLPVGG